MAPYGASCEHLDQLESGEALGREGRPVLARVERPKVATLPVRAEAPGLTGAPQLAGGCAHDDVGYTLAGRGCHARNHEEWRQRVECPPDGCHGGRWHRL